MDKYDGWDEMGLGEPIFGGHGDEEERQGCNAFGKADISEHTDHDMVLSHGSHCAPRDKAAQIGLAAAPFLN